jgi:hypothetical protein
VNRSLERGKRAEREVVALVAALTGWEVRRRLAGRSDDVGDLEGLPDCTVQVKSYVDITRAMNEALLGLPAQQTAARTRYAAAFIRRPGGRYVVAMEPSQFLDLLREATA